MDVTENKSGSTFTPSSAYKRLLLFLRIDIMMWLGVLGSIVGGLFWISNFVTTAQAQPTAVASIRKELADHIKEENQKLDKFLAEQSNQSRMIERQGGMIEILVKRKD